MGDDVCEVVVVLVIFVVFLKCVGCVFGCGVFVEFDDFSVGGEVGVGFGFGFV